MTGDIAPLEPGWVPALDADDGADVQGPDGPNSDLVICWRVTGAPEGTTLVETRFRHGRRIVAELTADRADAVVTIECAYGTFVQIEQGLDPAVCFMRNDMKHEGDHRRFLEWLSSRSLFIAEGHGAR